MTSDWINYFNYKYTMRLLEVKMSPLTIVYNDLARDMEKNDVAGLESLAVWADDVLEVIKAPWIEQYRRDRKFARKVQSVLDKLVDEVGAEFEDDNF